MCSNSRVICIPTAVSRSKFRSSFVVIIINCSTILLLYNISIRCIHNAYSVDNRVRPYNIIIIMYSPYQFRSYSRSRRTKAVPILHLHIIIVIILYRIIVAGLETDKIVFDCRYIYLFSFRIRF